MENHHYQHFWLDPIKKAADLSPWIPTAVSNEASQETDQALRAAQGALASYKAR